MADGKIHACNARVEQYLAVPPGEFGTNISGDEDLEGPFSVTKGIIIRQGDVLELTILDVVAVARECSDTG